MTTLLVNPQTGRDYLNVRIPAVVDYQAYLAAGHAPDTPHDPGTPIHPPTRTAQRSGGCGTA